MALLTRHQRALLRPDTDRVAQSPIGTLLGRLRGFYVPHSRSCQRVEAEFVFGPQSCGYLTRRRVVTNGIWAVDWRTRRALGLTVAQVGVTIPNLRPLPRLGTSQHLHEKRHHNGYQG